MRNVLVCCVLRITGAGGEGALRIMHGWVWKTWYFVLSEQLRTELPHLLI
jgi:hypothetical protein